MHATVMCCDMLQHQGKAGWLTVRLTAPGSAALQASGCQLQDSDSFISPKVSSEPSGGAGGINVASEPLGSQELPHIVSRDWEIDMAALQASYPGCMHNLWRRRPAAACRLQLQLPLV